MASCRPHDRWIGIGAAVQDTNCRRQLEQMIRLFHQFGRTARLLPSAMQAEPRSLLQEFLPSFQGQLWPWHCLPGWPRPRFCQIGFQNTLGLPIMIVPLTGGPPVVTYTQLSIQYDYEGNCNSAHLFDGLVYARARFNFEYVHEKKKNANMGMGVEKHRSTSSVRNRSCCPS